MNRSSVPKKAARKTTNDFFLSRGSFFGRKTYRSGPRVASALAFSAVRSDNQEPLLIALEKAVFCSSDKGNQLGEHFVNQLFAHDGSKNEK